MLCVLVCSLCIIKYHRLGGLTNRSLFLTVLEARRPSFRCQQGSFHSEDASLGSQVGAILLHARLASLYACGERERERALWCLPIRTLVLSDQDPSLLTSFNPKYLPVSPVSKSSDPGSEGSTSASGWDTVQSEHCWTMYRCTMDWGFKKLVLHHRESAKLCCRQKGGS